MGFANFEAAIEESPATKWGKLIPISLVAAATVLGSTLAANISLGTSGSIEFGQGVVQTTACSGNTSLTMTPKATFVNSAGGGAFYFKSITVTNIPLGCQGSDFKINAYDSSTAVALALYDTSESDIIVYDSVNGFLVGGGKTGYTVSSGSDSFTVTFTVPVAQSTNVARLTIQSGIHTVGVSEVCGSNGLRSSGGSCRVGDIGSGGGTIFYVSATAFTATGASCNTNCHYLEFAPKGWASLTAVPNDISYNGQIIGARTNVNTDPTLVWTDGAFAGQAAGSIATGTAIGTGYSNTQQIKNNTTLGVHDERFAFIAALSYAGNNGTNTTGQWFLPSLKELNELCKYARGQISDLGDTSIECSLTGTTLNSSYGFSPVFYMSSTYGYINDGQVTGYNMNFHVNPLINQYYANYGNPFRPVRVS